MRPHRRLLFLLLALAVSGEGAAADTVPIPANATSPPLACSKLSRICTSFLAFPAANASVLESMFDASPGDLTADAAASPGYAFVCKNRSCLALRSSNSADSSCSEPFSECGSDGLSFTPAAAAGIHRLLLLCTAEVSDDAISSLVGELESSSSSLDSCRRAAMELRLLAKNNPDVFWTSVWALDVFA